MQNDKTTLRDLSVFPSDGSGALFALLDHCTSQIGKDMLRKHIFNPPDNHQGLVALQDTIKFWADNLDAWPKMISNGTLVMLDGYFESADSVSAPPSGFTLLLNTAFLKLINKQEYFYTQFSLSHLSDFLRGCTELVALADKPNVPSLLQRELDTIKDELKHRLTQEILAVTKQTSYTTLTQLNYKARRETKNMFYRLMNSYARLDAWQSMARATVVNKWVFPELKPDAPVVFETNGLYHPLLDTPVTYDIAFDTSSNFLLLTGANMSGKTTFMRAIGVSALLAHLGTGVPAKSMRVSFLYGIITAMQAEDNILKGESYFYAEVQRMKQTAEKLTRHQPHLVLMDELFKGTNVHDAYECTKAVVEGLLNHRNHLMILSTHLYEVAQQFAEEKGILFAYFVTNLSKEGGYEFTYQLKTGISNDRIGYLILQKEGVLDLLHKKS
jgi:DNA mismatch repair protein MutS